MERWFLYLVAVVLAAATTGRGANVTYDGRSLIIDGERKLLFSGSIHYPRSTPEMWPSLITKTKRGGIDVIETYVFWNLHEPQPGQYDFSGRRDIVRFLKEIQAQGLYACLRIGPFIESEWTYGGFPFWLHDVPGIVYRSDNEPFKFYMQNFTTKIVNMMKSEGLYASQGGPIILSQIENEYQNVEKAFHEKGPPYVRWAAAMAVGLETGIPWVMCKQTDAPDPVINTCNGMRCGQTFQGPNSPNKPSLWTENWTSFYQVYGNNTYIRSAEDIAYHVALFIAKKNGSFVNYYMYHGGTNFGRTASAYVITSYYDQAPLDEYGLLRQPKWGHLKELHAAIKLCSQTLLAVFPANISLGPLQDAYVFKKESGECAAFIVNANNNKNVVVLFQNSSYELPPKSVSILPDCKNVAFNTAKVSTQFDTRSMLPAVKLDSNERWEEFKEPIPQFEETSLKENALLEHMSTTKDASDYLWYTARFQQDSASDQSVLGVNSVAHVLHGYVDGAFVGSAHGTHENTNFALQSNITLSSGINNVSLLSVMVGLPDSGAFLERRFAGLRAVRIQDKQGNITDLQNYTWGYQVGLLGEKLQAYSSEGLGNVEWSSLGSSPQPLTWFKTTFDAPTGDDPVALNLNSMGKGEAWVNGQSIGRYWVSFHTPEGSPSQTWYNIPRSFINPGANLLVLFEEEYGNPLGISIDTVAITKVCGHAPDSNLPPVSKWRGKSLSERKNEWHICRRPRVHLQCPQGKTISRILFASYGSPTGDCHRYSLGSCHSSNSMSTVEKACLGKSKCSIANSYKRFGGDPCPGIPKALLVDVQCE